MKLLKLYAEKWKHVKYIIVFLYFFFQFIRVFFKFTNSTVHQVWAIYNNFFQYLKNWYSKTEYKLVWKNNLQTVIENAQNKFDKYYKQIKHVKEEFYVIAAVLDSYFQMNAYRSDHWKLTEWMTY